MFCQAQGRKIPEIEVSSEEVCNAIYCKPSPECYFDADRNRDPKWAYSGAISSGVDGNVLVIK
jgi:hypothetical protein